MTGSPQITSRLFILSLVISLSAGCQFMPKNNEPTKPSVTSEELETSSQTLQNSFQQQLAALEERQLASQQQQAKELQQLRKLVEHFQKENIHYQRQHTFQIEQLSKLLEPSSANGPITEVIQNDGKLILGQYEWLHLPAQQLVLPARIDSGANTSSLHALNLQEFERDGKSWVRFETQYQPENTSAEKKQPAYKAVIEAPLVRKVNVTQASGSETRPVISLPIQLGTLTQTIEFTLTDRGNLVFPILLGRRFFMDIAVIDVSKAYVQGKPKQDKKEQGKQEQSKQEPSKQKKEAAL